MFNDEDVAERALDDDIDDAPTDFGEDEDDGGDDPKPDDDSKKTPTAPPKSKEPPVVKRDDHVPVGDPTMDHT